MQEGAGQGSRPLYIANRSRGLARNHPLGTGEPSVGSCSQSRERIPRFQGDPGTNKLLCGVNTAGRAGSYGGYETAHYGSGQTSESQTALTEGVEIGSIADGGHG
jgi:hypothetical protein